MTWQYFPLAAAWLTQHAWEHYDFTRDLDYFTDIKDLITLQKKPA